MAPPFESGEKRAARLARLHAKAEARPAEPPGAACPEPEAWQAGVAALSDAQLRHAAACPHCGPRLREAAGANLEEESSPLEAALLAGLPSSRKRGQRQLARRMRRWHRGAGGRRTFLRGWAYAVAAVVVAAAGMAYWTASRGRVELAGWLLDRAYGQQRTLALRFAGADYGPLLPATRQAPTAATPDWLTAEALLSGGLAKRPADARLLQGAARAALLRGDAATAIGELLHALVADPQLSGGRNDLGTAYFLSAAGGREADYGTALDEFGQVLAQAPRDPIALFNRALVEEALADWTGAITDWESYLQVDGRSPWAGEAGRRLAADRNQVQAHDQATAAGLLPAAAISAASLDDARIEDYLADATMHWLPAAFPVAGAPDAAAQRALAVLAQRLAQAHRDLWLQQFLEAAGRVGRRQLSQAVAELAAAEAANQSGHSDAALPVARRAAADFAAMGNPAGRRRAAFIVVDALHRAEQGQACVAALQDLGPAPALAADAWLDGEAALNQYDCDGMLGRPNLAALARSEQIAAAAAYPALRMRAAAFRAVAAAPAPDADATWRAHRQQLTLYWTSRVGAYRGYALYMGLAIFSAARQQPFAAERLARAAVERVATTPDAAYRAAARQQLADFAEQCGFPQEAEEQRARAAELFHQLPASAANANLQAYNLLDQAADAMQSGHPAAARAQLAAYRRDQPPVDSLNARALPYFTLLGQWELAQGHTAQAAADVRAALDIRESDLRAYSSDPERAAWQQQNRDAYRSWVEIQAALHPDPLPALEAWEWARGTSVRSSRLVPAAFLAAARAFNAAGSPALPAPGLVKAELPSLRTTQVVSYFVARDELWIWLYDNRGVQFVRVAVAPEALASTAHAFAVACADPGSDARARSAEAGQLYRWLLAPVAAWLDPTRTLVVEPDGPLNEIPFAALQTPAGDYLQQPLLQSPGMEYAHLAHPESWLRRPRVLAVANPALGLDAEGDAYPPLPAARAEAAEIAAQGAAGSRLLSGPDATLPAVLAALPGAELFHFAGHADAGRLLLAQGGALNATSFTAPRLARCQLAVLAACSTGANDDRGLLDASGMVRALLRAGVPRVVATRWAVDSAATHDLCQGFYAALRSGEAVSSALLTAQQQLRRNPATAAPFYWAGFAAFGAQP